MPKRVLVTGATGTVGRHLTRRLVAEGVAVRALCRNPARAVLPEQAERVAGDLTDRAAVREALRDADRAYMVLADDAGAACAEAIRDHASTFATTNPKEKP